MSSSSENGKGFVCPFPGCGRTFTLERGLTRHYNYEHKGGEVGDLPDVEPIDVGALAAPLHEAIANYEQRLAEITAERDAITAAIRPVKAAIAALEREHGKPGPKRKTNPINPAKVEAIREWIEAHAAEQFPEGFTVTKLVKAAREDGIKMHESTGRLAVYELHQLGVVRAIRKTVGGGQIYAPVGGPAKPYPRTVEPVFGGSSG